MEQVPGLAALSRPFMPMLGDLTALGKRETENQNKKEG